MIVCVCKVVSDRRINQEIDSGTRTMSEMAKRCDAGTDCGACCAQIRAMISDRCKPHLRLVGGTAA